MRSVGLLRNKWDRREYVPFLQYLFQDNKTDILKELSEYLKPFDLAIQHHPKKGLCDDAGISLCWRNGEGENHHKWTRLKSDEIGVLVAQRRSVGQRVS